MDDSYGVSDNSFQEVMKMLKLVQTLDEKGNEEDAIIELPDSTWGAFEIKLGANQIDKAAEDLLKIEAIMEKEGDRPPSLLCVICGLSNAAYRRPDGVYVVPITALREQTIILCVSYKYFRFHTWYRRYIQHLNELHET